MVVLCNFLSVYSFLVDSTPRIDDVCQDERNKEADIKHGLERELARRTVPDRQRTLEVGRRRIVSGIVPTCNKKEHEYHEYHADACRPDAADITGLEDGPDDSEKQQYDACKQDHSQRPHRQKIIQILHRFHEDYALLIDGIAFTQQGDDEERQEEKQEQNGIDEQLPADTLSDDFIVHIVIDIERAEDPGEEHHGDAEDDNPRIEQHVQTARAVCPLRDDRLQGIGDVPLLDDEIGSRKEGGNGPAQKQGAENAVEDQADLESAYPEEVAGLVLELITDGLDNECEQYQQPHPVGTAEARTVEQRERSEESTAECNERRERELPLAADGVDQQLLLPLRAADGEEQRLPALYEHEEHQQRAKQRHEQPPVVLKKAIRYIHETMC